MKHIIYIFVFVFIQGCIPLNNVHHIDTYEIKEGKPKSRNINKKYTKYMYTNASQNQILIKFLEDKFGGKNLNNLYFAAKEKLFLDENIEFEMTFILETKEQRYLNLISFFFFNKNNNDSYYDDDDSENLFQEGEKYRYVSVSITDDDGVDYLAKKSQLRDRLIVYLKNLKREYEVFRRNYNFINGN